MNDSRIAPDDRLLALLTSSRRDHTQRGVAVENYRALL